MTEGKPATASNIYQGSSSYSAARAVDGDNHSRWATDATIAECWLEVDLGEVLTFDRAMLDECVDFGERVKSFQLQCRDGDAWKTFFEGTSMGAGREVRFAPVIARYVRLTIEGTGGPTINEFQLFAPAKQK